MTHNADNPLKYNLERLEHSVEAPIVPGELTRWLQSAEEALAKVQATFQEQVTHAHKEHLETISVEDSGLLSRVEKMQSEDDAISKGLGRLSREVHQLLANTEIQQEDEAAARDTVKDFVEDTISLVIRIRKQEAALETWLSEALQRDRGIAD